MGKRKSNKTSTHGAALASVQGRQRDEHYANGGTPQMWRGAARTLDNKTKARADKAACRGRFRPED